MTSTQPAATLSEIFGFGEFPSRPRAASSKFCGLAGRRWRFSPPVQERVFCYQLPALEFDGLAIVVSPLLALDEGSGRRRSGRKGIAAERLDSTLGLEETQPASALAIRAGAVKLLYVSPERFSSERFLTSLTGRKLSLVAVDEAHCISEWGHNFRPDYLKLAKHRASSSTSSRVLALTATAPPTVASDIAAAFDIAADDVVQTGFYRPNLSLHVPAVVAGQRPTLLARPAAPARAARRSTTSHSRGWPSTSLDG